jgi:hypothetical protein
LNILSQFLTPKVQEKRKILFFLPSGTSLDKKNVWFLGIVSSVAGSSANKYHFLFSFQPSGDPTLA